MTKDVGPYGRGTPMPPPPLVAPPEVPDVEDDPTSPVRNRVFVEAARFRAKLSSLLPIYADQWVVFRDDAVVSAHATEEEAYVAGLKRFGPHGGHIVAAVREEDIVALSAVSMLGL